MMNNIKFNRNKLCSSIEYLEIVSEMLGSRAADEQPLLREIIAHLQEVDSFFVDILLKLLLKSGMVDIDVNPILTCIEKKSLPQRTVSQPETSRVHHP